MCVTGWFNLHAELFYRVSFCGQMILLNVAQKIGLDYYRKRKGRNCASSCSFLKVKYDLLRETKLKPYQIRFFIPDSIEVQSAFYVYEVITLIAEVGGYVGLFLGYSVYQITDMFEMCFSSVKRKLSFKHVP